MRAKASGVRKLVFLLQGLLKYRRGGAFQDIGSTFATRYIRSDQLEVRQGLEDGHGARDIPCKIDVECCISWVGSEHLLPIVLATGATNECRNHPCSTSVDRARKKHGKAFGSIKYREIERERASSEGITVGGTSIIIVFEFRRLFNISLGG